MYDYNDIIRVFFILIINHGLIKLFNIYIYDNKLKNKTVWFYLHFIGNMYVVYCAVPSVLNFINNPIHIILSKEDLYDTRIIVLCIHLYHHLLFKLNNEDWYHHVFFVYCGTLLIHLVPMGECMSIYHLFASGLPGGLLYISLVFEDMKIINKTQRLKIASFLNVWIRSIGLTMSGCIFIIRFLHYDKSLVNWMSLFIALYCSIYNGQHYMEEVIRADEKNKYIHL
jgi:hypothetical protein